LSGKIEFGEQKQGYNKMQVDSYINEISTEYKTMHAEHTELLNKYSALSEAYQKVSTEKNSAVDSFMQVKSQLHTLKNEIEKLNQENAALKHENTILKSEVQELWKENEQINNTSPLTDAPSIVPPLYVPTEPANQPQAPNNAVSPEAVAKALIDAEMLAAKIIQDAKDESEKISAESKGKLVETEAQAKQIMENANSEAACAVEAAKKDLIQIRNAKNQVISDITDLSDRLRSLVPNGFNKSSNILEMP